MTKLNQHTVLGVMTMSVAFLVWGCGDDQSDPGRNGGGPDGGVNAPDTTPAPDAVVCNQLAAAAQAQFDSYMQSTASLACQKNSDCSVIFARSLNCFLGCGLIAATAAIDTITAATASLCDPYSLAGCPEKTPPPCMITFVACEHGLCVRDAGAPDPADAADAASEAGLADVPATEASGAPDAPMDQAPDPAVCDQLSRAARAEFDSYFQSRYSEACQVDSDCAFLQTRQDNCFTACGSVVARTADLAAITDATDTLCDAYFGAGCPAITPPCPYARAACDRGTCIRVGAPGVPDAAVDAGGAPVDGGPVTEVGRPG
jgi:hypothetical protein